MNKFSKRVLSAVVSLMLVLALLPCTAWADAVVSEEEIVIPGVMTAADILAVSEDMQPEEAAIEPVAEVSEESAPIEVSAGEMAATETEILVKYLGATELTEDEVYDIVANMAYEDMEAAYAEMEAYAMTLTEEQLEVVSETMVYFAEAIEAAMTPALFSTNTFCDGRLSITDSANSQTKNDETKATITAKGSLFSTKTNTITVTNETEKKAQVSFAYSASTYSSFTVAGATASATGNWSGFLEAGASVTLVLISNKGLSGTTATLVISDLQYQEVQDNSTVVFEYNNSLGSVTVGGTAIASGASVTINNETGIEVAATANNGCSFLGWVNASTGAVLSKNASDTLKPGIDMTVKPIFVNPNLNVVFGVANSLFENLSDAITAAQSGTNKVVYLAANGTLPAGDYTVPADITLLIPFDSVNTCYTTEPVAVSSGAESLLDWISDEYTTGSYKTPTVYRKLTMANGANLTINGKLSVSNQIMSGNAGKLAGSPTGPVSMIQMNENSNITVNNGASAYVYGYIYGDGAVNVKSGATVYECMQVLDFRGGNATSNMQDNTYGVFPFSQYYVQNIEVPTTFEHGAKEVVVCSLTAGGAVSTSDVNFIGTGGCMFVTKTEGTTLVKQFVPSTRKLRVTVNGDVGMESLELSMNNAVASIDINTKNFALPISSNISINLESGTAIVNQDLALLPGSEVNIAQGAVLTLIDGHSAYAYDLDEWQGQAFVYKNNSNSDADQSWLTYTATTTSTQQTLKDAKIDINGEINSETGCLYTTAGGAEVISSEGTGVVKVSPGTTYETVTYQAKQNNTDITYAEVPVTAAKLQNADKSYTETASPKVGKYTYKNGKWAEWMTVHFDANGGAGTMADQYVDLATATALNQNTFTKGDSTFLGWSLAAGGTLLYEDGANIDAVEEEITLYALWCDHTNKAVSPEAVEPTCMEDGNTEGLICSDCQKVLKAPEVIPATGEHSFINYKSNGDAKENEDGTKTALCEYGCGTEHTVIDVGSRTGLKNINLTCSGTTFTAIVEGYQGTATLYIGVYDDSGKLLAINTTTVTNDTEATVSVATAGASYAKAFAWNNFVPVALAKQIPLN